MSLQEIVNLQITRQTVIASQQGFSTLLILGPNANFFSRTQQFSDVGAALAAVLCLGSDAPEYKAAVDAMAQNPRLVNVKIGHIGGTKVITDDDGTWTADSVTATVNGVEIIEPFDTDKDTSMTNLAASIQALPTVLTAVYSSVAHTITITPITDGVISAYLDVSQIQGTMTVVVTAVGVEDLDDALDLLVLEDDDWYGLCTVTRIQSDQEDVAAWAETKTKIYIPGAYDANIMNTTDAADTTTLAAVLKAAAYARSGVSFLTNADTEYPDAATLGRLLPLTPGSYTANFKKLASITVDSLTGTQSTNVRAKYANSYERVGQQNMIRNGTVAEGEYIDVIIFIDWLTAKITEEVFGLLTTADKVPYTHEGLALISARIEKALKLGQNVGGISEYSEDADGVQNGGYIITLPDYDLIPSADKTNRILNNVGFTAWLTGAIHVVNIAGIVTY